MKKVILLLISLNYFFSASAQDIIVKKDGTVIKSTVLKVSESDVEYRNYGSSSERIYSVKTSSLISINYEDGTVDKFSSEEPVTAPEAPASGSMIAAPDVEKNKELIHAYNSPTPKFEGSYAKQGAKATCGLVKYAISDVSVLASDDLIISVETGSAGGPFYSGYISIQDKILGSGRAMIYGVPAIVFTVTNRTNRTLFLDLGNSFLTVGDHSKSYYTPGAQSTTTTNSNGASVNLGAVSSALGIGGAVGTLANGINVGGGNSTSSNSLVFNQRVVAVAPFSKFSMEPQSIQDNDYLFVKKGSGESVVSIYNTSQLLQGSPIEYSEFASPSKLLFFLSYSYSEDCQSLKQMSVNLFAKEIYGLNHVTVFDWKQVSIPSNALFVAHFVSDKR